MDLGINGRRALVCAASKGLGRGCAEALAAEGVDLVINARGVEALESTAESLRAQFGVSVAAVAADITTELGREQVLAAAGDVDILVNNAGGPPPGSWRDWERDDFIAAFDANTLAPIALMKALLPRMVDRRWGRVVNITSMSVKAPIGVLGLSNTARTALTGYVAGVSREVARHGVVVNNLLPGLHATDRTIMLDQLEADATGEAIDVVKARRVSTIPAGDYGTAEDFGRMCAYLCSQHVGFMVGQNVLLDGGFVNTTL